VVLGGLLLLGIAAAGVAAPRLLAYPAAAVSGVAAAYILVGALGRWVRGRRTRS
jgi:hypothetical protein